MARKFLYLVAGLTVLVIAALVVLRLWSADLTRLAFVPDTPFAEPAPLKANAYADPALWYSRPGMSGQDPSRWQPAGGKPATAPPRFAVFFIHPTSYLERAQWNAPIDDAESRKRARLFLRGMASPFASAAEIWAPRYRQATLGAMLVHQREATRATDLAYGDVAQAFDAFLAKTDPSEPIVLAGHSQGALHLIRLLREKIAGTPLQSRIAAAYVIGWPISLAHDLPALGLPACTKPHQAACIMSWSSYAEPADPSEMIRLYDTSTGLDGKPRKGSAILCTNPLTGGAPGAAPASANLGTLKPDEDMAAGELVPGGIPARCDRRGLLLIGAPPELGPYVLPGNNYHVYDIPMFWRNVQADVAQRVAAWQTQR